MDLLVKEINFHELLEESIASLKYMDGAESVRSMKSISVNTPFYSDHSRLLIVFNNIISNAVRYRDSYKDDSFISVDIFVNDCGARITFSDNGIGIAPQYIENIFKMFFRATADSKGSGLGLYIVKSAVEKLQGSVKVESQFAVGTTFIVSIPNLIQDCHDTSIQGQLDTADSAGLHIPTSHRTSGI
jgi:signal transduction histidine kinase